MSAATRPACWAQLLEPIWQDEMWEHDSHSDILFVTSIIIYQSASGKKRLTGCQCALFIALWNWKCRRRLLEQIWNSTIYPFLSSAGCTVWIESYKSFMPQNNVSLNLYIDVDFNNVAEGLDGEKQWFVWEWPFSWLLSKIIPFTKRLFCLTVRKL